MIHRLLARARVLIAVGSDAQAMYTLASAIRHLRLDLVQLDQRVRDIEQRLTAAQWFGRFPR